MIEIMKFSGPGGLRDTVKGVLKSIGVPEYTFVVYEESYNKDFPKLARYSTLVYFVVNKKNLKQVTNTLKHLGFSEDWLPSHF